MIIENELNGEIFTKKNTFSIFKSRFSIHWVMKK